MLPLISLQAKKIGEKLFYPLSNKAALRGKYCNKEAIKKGLLAALMFSVPLFAAQFSVAFAPLVTLAALAAFYLWIRADDADSFWMGVFVGLIWFYWISFSFIYYELAWLIPVVLVGIAILYGLIFWLLALVRFLPLKAFLAIWYFDWLSPFGFNWLKPELLLLDSYFGVDKLSFALLLSAVTIVAVVPKNRAFLSLLPLLAAFCIPFFQAQEPKPAPLRIKLVSTTVSQDLKWDDALRKEMTKNNFAAIDAAISDGYEMVVMPETAFPYALNKSPKVEKLLLQKSRQIAIVTGALRYDETNVYNSTYVFVDGNVSVMDKVVAVPFGEKTPLPRFFVDIVNTLFFNGAQDYDTAALPQDFTVFGVKFRNAICYEATQDLLFFDRPSFMIAMSNNAWFIPSVEPTLQKQLMRYFAAYYGTVIYHAVNGSESFTVDR